MNCDSIAISDHMLYLNGEKKSDPRIKLNDATQQIKDRFNLFVEECKYSHAIGSEARFNQILEHLKLQSYTIYNKDQLAEVFENLLNKASNNRFYGRTNWGETETNYLISIVVYYCISSANTATSLV